MGFRCPGCHEDFGYDRDKLIQHLSENPECKKVASILFPTEEPNTTDDYKPNFEVGDDAFS